MSIAYGRSNSMMIISKNDESDIMSNYFNHDVWKNKIDDPIPDAPFDVQLELINKCNLSCVSCPINYASRKTSMLNWDVLKKVVDESASEGVAYFTICGIGESVLHPRLFDLLEYIRKSAVIPKGLRQLDFMPSLLVSNGIWKESHIQNCIHNPPDLFSLSLSGLNDDDILKRRGKINIKKLWDNIGKIHSNRYIKREIDGRTLPIIHVSTHIYPKEFSERIEEIKLFCDKWFPVCDVVVIKPTMVDLHFRDYSNFLNSNYKNLSIDKFERTSPCFETSRRLSINSDGDVWCGHHNSEDFGHSLGNIYNQGIREIWHGDVMNEFRAEVRAGIFKRYNCQLCGGEIREEKR